LEKVEKVEVSLLPADAMDEPVMCMDLEQVAETLNEWINDPNRERFDPVEMEEDEDDGDATSSKKGSERGPEKIDDIFKFTGKMDAADELLFNIGSYAYNKLNDGSNGYRDKRKRSRRSRRKGSSKK